jgi:glycosyltransferase involved in cell wall biosynthesis
MNDDDAQRPVPGLAIISNGLTPYRVHFHQRIVREIPEFQLHSVLTHEDSSSPWDLSPPAEINVVRFGAGEKSGQASDPRRQLHEWRKGGRIIEWLKATRIAVVVVLGYSDAGRMRIIRWCHRSGVPVFLFGDSNIRGDLARGAKAVAKRLLVSKIISWTDGVMPCGTLGEAFFRKYGARDGRIFYVPYEPDYDQIRSTTPDQVRQARERYHIEPNRRHLIYSGRLAEAKRVDLLIDAFAAIAGERPNWSVIIVGDGPLRAALHDRVPAPLADRFIWTGFLNDQSTINTLYHAADVLVLPSQYEPWALVVNEAAAAGLAIVASDVVGAAAELVRDGENGWTFRSGDLPELTARLLDVTASENAARYREASLVVLADWQERSDPVKGLRAAISLSGPRRRIGRADHGLKG